MGLAGAVLSQHLRLIDPTNTFDPSKMTFLVWVMLIAGGSGNNRGHFWRISCLGNMVCE